MQQVSNYSLIDLLHELTDLLTLYLGNIYIADYNNYRVRKVTVSTVIITTFAGTGTSSFSGDNGPATAAELKYPSGVALDSAGSRRYFYL